jgi:hypothetical protein
LDSPAKTKTTVGNFNQMVKSRRVRRRRIRVHGQNEDKLI